MACKYFSIVCTLHCMPHASACRARALCMPHAPHATHTLCTPHACSARFKLTKPIANVTIIERRSRPAATRNAPSKLVRLKLFEPIQPTQNFYCRSLELLNNSLKIFWFFFLPLQQSKSRISALASTIYSSRFQIDFFDLNRTQFVQAQIRTLRYHEEPLVMPSFILVRRPEASTQ